GAGMEGRVPELLLSSGSFWGQLAASGRAGCAAGGDFASAARGDRGIQEADGLDVSVVFLKRHGLQFRFSGFPEEGRGRKGRGLLQLRHAEVPERRETRGERVL